MEAEYYYDYNGAIKYLSDKKIEITEYIKAKIQDLIDYDDLISEDTLDQFVEELDEFGEPEEDIE